jgi:hypothetical protein
MGAGNDGHSLGKVGQQGLGNPVLHGAGVAHHTLLISEHLAASLGGRDFSVLPWKMTYKDHVYNSRGLTDVPSPPMQPARVGEQSSTGVSPGRVAYLHQKWMAAG